MTRSEKDKEKQAQQDFLARRDFLASLGKWSRIVAAGAVAGSLFGWGREAEARRGSWVNRRGGGGWANRTGGGAWSNRTGGWYNRAGGWANRGGGTWANRTGGWANRGGGGWVNRRGGGGSWANRY
jgi:hypothetical protein